MKARTPLIWRCGAYRCWLPWLAFSYSSGAINFTGLKTTGPQPCDTCAAPRWWEAQPSGPELPVHGPVHGNAAIAADVIPPHHASQRPAASRRYCQWLHV